MYIDIITDQKISGLVSYNLGPGWIPNPSKAPNITARVFPKNAGADGELGQAIFNLASQNSWKISEIKKEEGRLDDVFRNITMSDTETN